MFLLSKSSVFIPVPERDEIITTDHQGQNVRNDNGPPYTVHPQKNGEDNNGQTFKNKNTRTGNNGRNNAIIQGCKKG